MRERACVDIVGDGEERAALEALLGQYHLQQVVLHGKQTGSELLAFYRSADIFVLPSLKEGVSLAMLEALAAGLPVVASDRPEIRQFLGECGLLIENPTASAYAQVLDLLVRDQERRKHLSTLAVRKARTYSWQSMLAAIDHVYEELVHEYQ
ncbi:hypothetical protein KSF_085730 [Reticulibacter mediterranei]|uniref:Glycosyl transferase family 1 domain-containing protein n=1 Tax=Reticulibacter mediterranei TaxID=2778369 RepID=A0A8J3IU15_9CHLR|nr:glycosyltransferase family 4 protein [Reticulibacter mediterranei]GHO98525.1 hypothetical protein KSF_085730 [Reticulibacter mediterranei]